jgi:hypothetical protein
MKPKATEVRLIAQLLEEPAEDTNDLAAKILEALAAKRKADDTVWIGLFHWDGVMSAYGPYPTQNQASKALDKLVAPGPGGSATVRQLRSIDGLG